MSMTKNEAIEIFKKLHGEYTEDKKERAIMFILNNWNEVCEKIQALDILFAMKYVIDIVEKYEEIGTVDECRAAMEKIRKIEEVVKKWDIGYAYSNSHMCDIKMIVKGGGEDE